MKKQKEVGLLKNINWWKPFWISLRIFYVSFLCMNSIFWLCYCNINFKMNVFNNFQEKLQDDNKVIYQSLLFWCWNFEIYYLLKNNQNWKISKGHLPSMFLTKNWQIWNEYFLYFFKIGCFCHFFDKKIQYFLRCLRNQTCL